MTHELSLLAQDGQSGINSAIATAGEIRRLRKLLWFERLTENVGTQVKSVRHESASSRKRWLTDAQLALSMALCCFAGHVVTLVAISVIARVVTRVIIVLSFELHIV